VRRNKTAPVSKIRVVGEVEIPELGMEDPHPLVAEMWVAQHRSAQRQFMEPTDWVHFKIYLTYQDELLKTSRKNANLVMITESMAANHGVAEGHRRKSRIEVERVSVVPVKSENVADFYRRKMEIG
jgi:hypothetical protein